MSFGRVHQDQMRMMQVVKGMRYVKMEEKRENHRQETGAQK